MASKKSTNTNSDTTMKVLIVVALLAAFIGGYLVSRAKYKPQIIELSNMVKDKDVAMQQLRSQANKIMMQNGAMMIIENGVPSTMVEDFTLTNGDVIMLDGKVEKKDGTTAQMMDGDSIDMDGMMTKAEVEEMMAE